MLGNTSGLSNIASKWIMARRSDACGIGTLHSGTPPLFLQLHHRPHDRLHGTRSSFHRTLVGKFGKSTVPTLTGKKLVKFSSSTIMHRREKLQQFLKDILNTPYLRESTELKLFLSVQDSYGDGSENLSGDEDDQ
jgi:hypothetical protein